MKKRLLLSLMAMCVSVGLFAITVNTKTGCYLTTGNNICTNGTFADADFTGWTPVSANEGTVCTDLFVYSAENQSISSLSNLYSEGMYYKFAASASESYVVSFKIRQVTGTWPFSTNVLYTTADEVNTYGCQGSNGAGKNFISLFGNNGGVNSSADFVNAGYAIQLSADWQTVTFATIPDGTTRDWYFYICNMATDVEIKDVEIYPAVEVADVRKTIEPLAFAKAIRDAYEWGDSDELEGLNETIEIVEGITEENSAAELTEALDGLQEAVNVFIKANLDDYLATCATGSKWADVTTKGQKIKTIGDWNTFDFTDGEKVLGTDRMMHCNSNDAAVREANKEWLSLPDYGYGSALGSRGIYMTKEIKKGTYFFSMKGNCHTFYQSNTPYAGANGYQSNDGFETGYMILAIEDAEGNVIGQNAIDLPAALDYSQNILSVKIPEDGKYNFVVYLSQPVENGYYGESRSYGGSYYLTTPQIYCKLEGYNAKELAYIDAVKAQINAARTNYDTAIGYLSKDYFWGKAELRACTDTMIVKLNKYEAYDDAAIVATFDQETYVAGPTNENAQLEHEVYVEVAKVIIDANKKFLAVNDTLNSLQVAIDNAEATMALRIYDAVPEADRQTLKDKIADAKEMLAGLKMGDYDEDKADWIVMEVSALNEAVETFKAAVPASAITTLADIDFSNAAMTTDGVTTIAGAVNFMTLPNYNTDDEDQNGTNSYYYQGFWSNGEKVYSDMLRVGNGEAIVAIDADKQVSGTNILKVSFDYYFARLTKTNGTPGGTYSGFYLKDAENNIIAQLYYSPYWEAVASEENNTFGLDITKKYLPSVGASSAQNDAIAASSNVTHFEVILDYGTKKMYCTTTTSTGNTQTSDQIAFEGTQIATFSVVSSHENAARRCWFDDLKIEQIQAGEPDGIQEINTNNTKVVAPSKMFKNGRIIINGKYGINGVLVK